MDRTCPTTRSRFVGAGVKCISGYSCTIFLASIVRNGYRLGVANDVPAGSQDRLTGEPLPGSTLNSYYLQ